MDRLPPTSDGATHKRAGLDTPAGNGETTRRVTTIAGNSDGRFATTGAVLANTYRYDAWGQSIGTSGTTYNPFQFTGVYLDSATGLYRMTQRYYGPASGRFTQLDPTLPQPAKHATIVEQSRVPLNA